MKDNIVNSCIREPECRNSILQRTNRSISSTLSSVGILRRKERLKLANVIRRYCDRMPLATWHALWLLNPIWTLFREKQPVPVIRCMSELNIFDNVLQVL